MQENDQNMDFTGSIKSRKQMKSRDQRKSQSMAQNSFVEQTCSMEGDFPNCEKVKGRKKLMAEMRSKEDLRSQSIFQNGLVWVKLRFQITKGGPGLEE